MTDRTDFMKRNGQTSPNLNSVALNHFQYFSLNNGIRDFTRSFILSKRTMRAMSGTLNNVWITSNEDGLSLGCGRHGFPIHLGEFVNLLLLYSRPSRIMLLLNRFCDSLDQFLAIVAKITHLVVDQSVPSEQVVRLLSRCARIDNLECPASLLRLEELHQVPFESIVCSTGGMLEFKALQDVRFLKLDISAFSTAIDNMVGKFETTEELVISHVTFFCLTPTSFDLLNLCFPNLDRLVIKVNKEIRPRDVASLFTFIFTKDFEFRYADDLTIPNIIIDTRCAIEVLFDDLEESCHECLMDLTSIGIKVEYTTKETNDYTEETYRMEYESGKVHMHIYLVIRTYPEETVNQIMDDMGLNDDFDDDMFPYDSPSDEYSD